MVMGMVCQAHDRPTRRLETLELITPVSSANKRQKANVHPPWYVPEYLANGHNLHGTAKLQ